MRRMIGERNVRASRLTVMSNARFHDGQAVVLFSRLDLRMLDVVIGFVRVLLAFAQ